MTIQDPIADMFTRIRNAYSVNKPNVEFSASKFKQCILELLKEQGFIDGYSSFQKNDKPYTKVDLKYYTTREGIEKSVIESIKKISKPSLHIYKSKNELPKVRGGSGLAIISTSKGLMSSSQAAKNGIGGEVIAEVY
jgi:small subunit ribosomal protein S8